ncbi:MAG: autotransporter domain-containing protein [Cetobacterium sp.]
MNIYNTLKHCLKRKVSITEALLVSFLITGSLGYSMDITEDYVHDNVITEGVHILKENGNIINNGSIVSNKSNAINSNVFLKLISNNGILFGKNGILVKKGFTNLINNGVVRGVTDTSLDEGTGNGIYIKGSNSINNNMKIENNGIIFGQASTGREVGNGLLVSGNYLLDTDINNSGKIHALSGFGNAISIINDNRTSSKIYNSGYILGDGYNGRALSFQIFSNLEINQFQNKGVLRGITSNGETDHFGIGLYARTLGYVKGILKEANNYGVISGDSNNRGGVGIFVSGNINNYSRIDLINNNGIIMGKSTPVLGDIKKLNNSGLLVGKIISESGLINNGVKVYLDSTNNKNISQIVNGSGGTVDGKNIINGKLYTESGVETTNTKDARDSYTIAKDRTNYENSIINGAGVNKGALQIEGSTDVKGSIINGYGTAVHIAKDGKLVATDTIFNGGGLDGTKAVIVGDEGDNTITIAGTSIVNGDISLGSGDDKLAIDSTAQINGKISGGAGKDILSLGSSVAGRTTKKDLKIFHNISEIENLNIDGDVTIFETVSITGASNISLNKGDLTLRIDPTIKDESGKIIGHAFYDNTGSIKADKGNLVFGLNGLGDKAVISMGKTSIDKGVDDKWWTDKDHLKTNSLVLDAKLAENGTDVNVGVKEWIELLPSNPIPPKPEPPVNPQLEPKLYRNLNKVYNSIVSAGQIGTLANTTLLDDKTYNESLGGLLSLLDQLHSNNPYSYTFKSTRDSLKTFVDDMSYLTIKPKENEWIVQGKAIYGGIKADNKKSGKGHYGFDNANRNYKTTTNTVGGLATFEYGLDNSTSVGIALGGNTQKVSFKGSSEIEGNSIYLGTFAKKELNDFKFMGGLGYQYTSADVTRGIWNNYDSFRTNSKYDLNSLNAFAEVKYTFNLDGTTKVEPKVRLSYYLINQDEVNEGYKAGNLSMGVAQQESNTFDLEVGVDFRKELDTTIGKVNNIFSIGVITTVGDRDNSLDGYILGKDRKGNKFEIAGSELPEFTGKVAYNLELEQQNGMIYSAGVDFEFADDYNRNITANIGIGYKF